MNLILRKLFDPNRNKSNGSLIVPLHSLDVPKHHMGNQPRHYYIRLRNKCVPLQHNCDHPTLSNPKCALDDSIAQKSMIANTASVNYNTRNNSQNILSVIS